MDDFYAARDCTMRPLPWPNIAPPFTLIGVSPKSNFQIPSQLSILTPVFSRRVQIIEIIQLNHFIIIIFVALPVQSRVNEKV